MRPKAEPGAEGSWAPLPALRELLRVGLLQEGPGELPLQAGCSEQLGIHTLLWKDTGALEGLKGKTPPPWVFLL